MAMYPNNPGVEFQLVQEAGDGNNALTRVTLGSHTGTHIDAPRHIQADGSGALVYLLEQMNGACEVVDLTGLESVISAADIPETKQRRILFRTKNSEADPDYFDDGFVALDDLAAEEMVRRGVRLVGLDALSIRKRGTKNQVHETFINSGIIIVEGLWLNQAPAGTYDLMCLPIKWNLDGAPARVVLRA